MTDKKDAGRFTIQFNAADPAHRRVIDILNAQGRRSKAQYLANAVLHYEACAGASDEKTIEAVVRRLLAERSPEADAPTQTEIPRSQSEDGALDAGALNAIADALDAFRGK
jgi:hypothetical protein